MKIGRSDDTKKVDQNETKTKTLNIRSKNKIYLKRRKQTKFMVASLSRTVPF